MVPKASKLMSLHRHSLALVHVQIPIEREVEQPQLGKSFLTQRFRLCHRWHTRINVHDRSGTRQTTLASGRMATGSRMTSARDGRTRSMIHRVKMCVVGADSPISFCTTLSPSPANLWMHLNLLPGLRNILDSVRVLHLQEAFHFFHCGNF